MKTMYLLLGGLLLLTSCNSGGNASAQPKLANDQNQQIETPFNGGIWRVVMASPGGELPFSMTVRYKQDQWQAVVQNDKERLELDLFEVHGLTVRFGLSHYESYFEGTLNQNGDRMEGTWTKVTGKDESAKLPFYAEYNNRDRFQFPDAPMTELANLAGRWQVSFDHEGEETLAVAEFRQQGAHLTGTFLTPTGDYRYLQGAVNRRTLYLSCFDGGHAFLFKASLLQDGTLSGDFWSRDSWHETWTAKRNEQAELPDPYALTSLKPGLKQFRFSFPDLQGHTVTQDDPMLAGKVRLITIFGSWCPNCNDEAPFLQELQNTYGDRGLQVMGLAFEMTGDTQRDTRVLERFKKRHMLDYPILLAGGSTDKEKAAEALPDLEHVLSYPTTILIDRKGEVAYIHTGFMGPGTGLHHEKLKQTYKAHIESLL